MDLYQQLTCHYRGTSRPVLHTSLGEVWTLDRLETVAERMRVTLTKYHLGTGDRILVQVSKSPQCIALYLCCLRFGYVLVPLNTAYTIDELDYFMADAQPAVVITDPVTPRPSCQVPVLRLDPQSDDGLLKDESFNAEKPTGPVPSETGAEIDGSHPATIIYTSGTTGRSKGAVLSRDNLLANAQCLVKRWEFTASDTLLHALPVFHVHGLFIALNTALLSGAHIVLLPRFDPDAVLKALPQATVMMGVPTYYVRLLARPEFNARACRNVRVFISGSAPLTVEVFEKFEQATGHKILERYGMSETNIIATNPLNGERCAGTVGFALEHTTIRIADDEDEACEEHQTGAVQVKGPGVFKGYWRRPDLAQSEFTGDGYFRTGDLGSLDADGRLTLVGRSKDLIITGGLNVYPAEIERLLNTCAGVVESAVVAAPDADFGERIEAFVVPDGSNEALVDSLSALVTAQLANFKRPKAFHLIDALPRNTMGKVRKNALRERLRTSIK